MAGKSESIKYHDFIRQFGKSTVKSLYLFQGQESFLIEEAIEHIKQAVIQVETADFNYDKFSGKDAQIGDILNLAQTIPFLSDWRLILLTDVQEMATQDQNQMIPYLSNPSPTTCLIMTTEKLDSRTKFAQTLKQHAEIVQFWKLYEREVPQWINGRAKQYGYTISLQTAAYLADFVGNDLRQLDNELKKIIAYSNNNEISLDAVQRVVGDIREHDIFELVDAVSEGNIIEVLRILNQLLVEGEQPLKILMMVTRQFRLLWKVKAHLAEKKSLTGKQLAEKVGVPYRTAGHLQKQAQRFSQVQIKQGFKRLCEVDRALKLSTNSPKILLEDVLMDLCVPVMRNT
jgi:DNA polymerase-3 subunit delta